MSGCSQELKLSLEVVIMASSSECARSNSALMARKLSEMETTPLVLASRRQATVAVDRSLLLRLERDAKTSLARR